MLSQNAAQFEIIYASINKVTAHKSDSQSVVASSKYLMTRYLLTSFRILLWSSVRVIVANSITEKF